MTKAVVMRQQLSLMSVFFAEDSQCRAQWMKGVVSITASYSRVLGIEQSCGRVCVP